MERNHGRLSACWRLPSILEVLHKEARNPSLRITALAGRMRLSRHHLGRIVKRATGQSYPQFIKKIRVEIACKQLADEGKSVKEVAAAAGFSSTAALDHAFKKLLGVSPSVHRNTLQARNATARANVPGPVLAHNVTTQITIEQHYASQNASAAE